MTDSHQCRDLLLRCPGAKQLKIRQEKETSSNTSHDYTDVNERKPSLFDISKSGFTSDSPWEIQWKYFIHTDLHTQLFSVVPVTNTCNHACMQIVWIWLSHILTKSKSTLILQFSNLSIQGHHQGIGVIPRKYCCSSDPHFARNNEAASLEDWDLWNMMVVSDYASCIDII